VIAGTSPRGQGWSCVSCRTEWWISVVNPRPPRLFVEYLAASVELTTARLALREIITLADQAPANDRHPGTGEIALPRRPRGAGAPVTTVDNPYRRAVERLVNLARERGFTFTLAGEQGSLWGERVAPGWTDVVFLVLQG
jgi:hypothetical protein